MQCPALRSNAQRLLRSLAAGLCLIAVGPAAWSTQFGSVAPSSLQAWKAFRAAQPFQAQLIGITGRPGDRERTIIVSEPPPSLVWSRIQQMLGPSVAGCTTRAWAFMAGGWAQDVVCTLKPIDASRSAELLAQLQLEVYGSAEGAAVVALPATPRRMTAHSLDFRFSANDLHTWLVKANPMLRGSPLAPALSLKDLLDKGSRGVYMAVDRSLVIWAVERGKPLDGHRAEIRRFALAGDIVLGAVANQRSVLIVARGRMEPVAHLPPLRSETVLLLAGSGERELAQSYERNDVISGKGPDGVDRAPILLSQQLVDTEFGTLLNVADQLLKGWSEAGQVKYVDFRYPAPPRYPFGTVPASEVQQSRKSFLFNWNTDGAAYVQTVAGLSVMVPQRTGSLSVIYGDPKDRPRDMEDTAYDYFASSGDTSLSRVQQYTLLYQIFRQFGVTAAAPAVSARFQRFSAEVDAITRRQFKWLLSDADEPTAMTAVSTFWRRELGNVPKAKFADQEGGREGLTLRLEARTRSLLLKLRAAQQASGGAVSEALADVVAAGRREGGASAEARARSAIQTLVRYLPEPLLIGLLKDGANGLRYSGLIQVGMEATKGWRALDGVESGVEGWNRTAYVVQSRGQPDAVGGHNLAAPLTRFDADAAVARGAISVTRSEDGSWVVRHNPADADRLRTVTREVGTRKDLSKAEIETQVARALQSARAEPPVALSQVRHVAGTAADFKAVSAQDAAWHVRAAAPYERDVLAGLSAARQDAIVVEMVPDGSFVLSRTGVEQVIQLPTVTAATDALSSALIASAAGGGSKIPVLLKGVPPEKAEAWLSTIHASLRRYPKSDVEAVLATAPDRLPMIERTRLVNSRIAHNGLRVDRAGVQVTRVKDGTWAGYMRVDVPVRLQTATPWYVRIVLYVKDISQAHLDRLLSRIETLVNAVRAPVSPAEMHALVRKELDRDLRELQVEGLLLHVPSDASNKVHDVFIARHDRATAAQWAA